MDKFAVLGELLYIISNYEKGRIKTTGIWSYKYKKSLRESLNIMSRITELLAENADVSQEELLPIMEFYWQNQGTIFPRKENHLMRKDNIKWLGGCNDCGQENRRKEVICYMRRIICDCFELLENRGRRYKYRIAYLLMAFHNLPKVYLDNTAETLCNIPDDSISEEDAITYAASYMDKI